MVNPKFDPEKLICNGCNKKTVCKYSPKMREIKKKVCAIQAEDTSLYDILSIDLKCREYATETPNVIYRGNK